LASATFTSETATGWQQVSFASPVAISANTTYVASYTDPNGGYAADQLYFSLNGVDSPPLHALADGADGADGVFSPGGGAFPSQSYSSTNYWVDVVVTTSVADTTPPTVAAVTPASTAGGIAPTTAVTARFSEAMTASSITTSSFSLKDPSNNSVSATVRYNS